MEKVVDVRCPKDYQELAGFYRPENHAKENARGYYFTAVQKAAGFFKSVARKHLEGTRMLVIGGGQKPMPDIQESIEKLNVDFDPDALRPLLLTDLNDLPKELAAEPGMSLRRVLSRASLDIDDHHREKLEKAQEALLEKPIGTVVISAFMTYVLCADVRKRLIDLSIAAVQPGGTVWLADRHALAFESKEQNNRGFPEARDAVAEWAAHGVTANEYFLAPDMGPKALEAIAQSKNNPWAIATIIRGCQYETLTCGTHNERTPIIQSDRKDFKIGLVLGQQTMEITKKA